MSQERLSVALLTLLLIALFRKLLARAISNIVAFIMRLIVFAVALMFFIIVAIILAGTGVGSGPGPIYEGARYFQQRETPVARSHLINASAG